MSHFAIYVVGNEPLATVMAPFDENKREVWIDTTEDHRKDYETESSSEFYCASSSSWGMQITQELFDFINNNTVGATKKYTFGKMDPFAYYKNNHKYCGYYELENGRRCEGDAWFEVIEINETTHPDSDVCFEGVITIRSIDPPKQLTLKEKYPIYEDYLSNYHGIEPGEKEGYWDNPKAKWDWYVEGGRWEGFLLTKDGRSVNSALKRDIDFAKMAQIGMDKAAERYDKAMTIFGDLPVHESWEAIRARYEAESKDMRDVRDEYWAQPRCEVWQKAEKDFHSSPDDFLISRERYIEDAGKAAQIVFGFLIAGNWVEKGEMGWFACVSDENENWLDDALKILHGISDNELITVVDCHI